MTGTSILKLFWISVCNAYTLIFPLIVILKFHMIDRKKNANHPVLLDFFVAHLTPSNLIVQTWLGDRGSSGRRTASPPLALIGLQLNGPWWPNKVTWMSGESECSEMSIILATTTNDFRCFTWVDEVVMGSESSRTVVEGLTVTMA